MTDLNKVPLQKTKEEEEEEETNIFLIKVLIPENMKALI